MKRLSNSPDTIRTQISNSESAIAHFEGELLTTPLEDAPGRKTIQDDLDAERKTLGRLQSHLDSLEDEFLGMSDTAVAYCNDFDE